jgi:antitoxin HigA-1
MKRNMPLIHPGLIFRENVIKEHGLSVTTAAELLKVTRPALSNVLNGHSDISPEMCLRISKVFGGSAEIWMNLQAIYSLNQVRTKIENLDLHPFNS